jgi:hypothetical protein
VILRRERLNRNLVCGLRHERLEQRFELRAEVQLFTFLLKRGTGGENATLDWCECADTSDFREWLIELAEKAEHAETLEQFLSQT